MGLGQRSDDQTEIKHLLSRNSAAISELVCRDRLSRYEVIFLVELQADSISTKLLFVAR